MPVQFHNGAILFIDDQVAMDPDCCDECADETCPLSIQLNIASVVNGIDLPNPCTGDDCDTYNGTHIIDQLSDCSFVGEAPCPCNNGVDCEIVLAFTQNVDGVTWDAELAITTEGVAGTEWRKEGIAGPLSTISFQFTGADIFSVTSNRCDFSLATIDVSVPP